MLALLITITEEVLLNLGGRGGAWGSSSLEEASSLLKLSGFLHLFKGVCLLSFLFDLG